MNTKKFIKLSAVALVLLLIPRRSTRKSFSHIETDPSNSDLSEKEAVIADETN